MRLISRLILSAITFSCIIFYSCNSKELYNARDIIKYENLLKWISEPTLAIDNLRCYYDYHDALSASKKFKKPVFLFFNGITCRADRSFERKVLGNRGLVNYLKNDFIVAHLFCDATQVLIPENEQYESLLLGSRVKSLGQKNIDIQASKYNSNTQPNSFFIDENENLLADKGYGYDPNPAKFVAHLEAVIANYNETHK